MTSFFPHSWLKSWRFTSRAARQRTRRPVAQLNLVDLEDRLLMACTVMNANNSGSGSFRQAILDANNGGCQGVITFNIGVGPRDINLTSALPDITRTVVIDGTTQLPAGGYDGMQFRPTGKHPLITFGSPGADGLVISASANNCVVRGLTIRSSINGIRLFSSGNRIEDNFIGTDPYEPNNAGNRDAGIGVYGVGNTIVNNLLSGNGWVGLDIPGALNTTVQGNYIGTDGAGTGAIFGWQGNRQGTGVLLRGGAVNTTIAGNLISGNAGKGIMISGSEGASVFTGVQGNYIGTNYNGTAVVGNGQEGIWIGNGAHNNGIGGFTPAARNVIAGNNGAGVGIFDSGTSSNEVVGNYIGTNAAGTAALGNAQGFWIDSGASGNTIGGSLAGAGNLISGNRGQGILLLNSLTTNNVVQGNRIGTDVSGTVALGNSHGVWLDFGASGNLIGGSTAGDGNLISGNRAQGVVLTGGAFSNVVQGNYIGTDVSGTFAVGNANDGVWIGYGAHHNTIGGTVRYPGVCNWTCNVIAGNNWGGVTLVRTDTVGNLVQGNFIGTDVSGSFPLGNGAGVWLDGASNNTIGGDAPAAGNMIVSSRDAGIRLLNSASNNTVRYNSIGTDPTGQAFLGNALSGVAIINTSSGNYVWDNTIAYNGGSGIQVGADAADLSVRNWLSRNAIFANAALGIDLGADGVTLNHDGFLPGPNNFQNFPELDWASSDGMGTTTVDGTFQDTAHPSPTTFVLEFFYNDAFDPSGFGQGQEFALPLSPLSLTVTTDASGMATFHFTLMGGMPGRYLTATATDPQGNTSEFSAYVEITAAGASPTGSTGRAVAWALSQPEAHRSAPSVWPSSREHALAESTPLQADGVPARNDRPDRAAVDAFFGGAAPVVKGVLSERTAAALPGDDDFLLGEVVLALNG